MQTYNKQKFETLINSILENADLPKVEILLLQDQNAKKWYDKSYTRKFNEITENTIYGIFYNDLVQHDFKVGKIENLLKSFLTKFTSNYKSFEFINGRFLEVKNKKEVFSKIIEKNQNRVYAGLFYTTLYGIGFWTILSDKKDMLIAKNLHTFLKNKNVNYENEYSDAGWVYRFKIESNNVEIQNELLNEFIKNTNF